MTFKEGLIKARNHIVSILGLLIAIGIVMKLEGIKAPANSPAVNPAPDESLTFSTLPSVSRLTAENLAWAKIAWQYFRWNTDPITGLANSVSKYPSTTMWDTGGYLLALVSAGRLGIIDHSELERRLELALTSLTKLPLCNGLLPNKAYNTHTLEMVDYNNKPAPGGTGWSAFDVGRMLIALDVIAWDQPAQAERVRQILAGWTLDSLFAEGHSRGYEAYTGMTYRERMIGYEQYFARSAALFGFDVTQEEHFRDTKARVSIESIEVPVGDQASGGSDRIVSEPFLLMGLELGFDRDTHPWADRILAIQQARFIRTNILTAVTEDHIDRAPWFVYNCIYSDGKAWQCLTKEGGDADDARNLSTKAAFAWDAIYQSEYTSKLIEAVKRLNDPEQGWFGGNYERDKGINGALSCNTNAVVIEALCYRAYGPLLRHSFSGKAREISQ